MTINSSLIIPTRGRPRLLADTIASVMQGRVIPDELVIVDQGNEAETLVWPAHGRECDVRHVRVHSVGLSRARNEGVRLARHELLAFLDDDMLVDGGWYGALISALREGGPRTVVTGAVHPGPRDTAGSFIPATVTRATPQTFSGRIHTDVLAGGNMGLWRAALDDVGLFDARLGAGSRWSSAEDNDLGFRLLEAGYRIQYVPEALVQHRAWRPSRDYYPLRWTYGLGKGGFYLKHASADDPHTLRRASLDLGSRLARLPSHLLRDRRRAVGDLVYSAGLLWGAALWVINREWRNHDRGERVHG